MKKIIAITLLISVLAPQTLLATTINPNNIISDEQLLDYDSMSSSRIQNFLENQSSALADYSYNTFGLLKTAANIVFDASQYYKISPKYLLITLQKEQSLITDSSPTQTQLDWATGYGCPDGGPKQLEYKGFFNQINWAAKRMVGEWYLGGIEKDGTTISGWGPGITKTTLDGIQVTPENAATAAMYTYTPWVGKYGGGDQRWGGATLVGKLWQDWFAPQYPDGSLLQVSGKPGVYLIKNGVKRPFWSKSAFLASFNKRNIIAVSQTEIDMYNDGPPIKFAEYSLLKGPNGNTYLISDNEKRLITSTEVFRQIGFNPEEVIDVEQSDIDTYDNGEDVDISSTYPTGILFQSKETGGVIYVKNGVRHPIWSKEILEINFPNHRLTSINESELEQYPKGDPVVFPDGTIVTSPGTGSVYVISNGDKRPVGSAETFNALGYKWENIVYTNDKSMSIHPLGPKLIVE